MPTAEERNQLYLDTYKSKTEDEIRLAYRNWAPSYEHHIIDQGWQAPELCGRILAEHLPDKNCKILDVGAGTGLVGQALRALGFQQIDALDLSAQMLEQARAKQVYRNIFVDSAERMDCIEDGSYDAVICVGALNFGHIMPSCLTQFIRVTRCGDSSHSLPARIFSKRHPVLSKKRWSPMAVGNWSKSVRWLRRSRICHIAIFATVG